MFALGMHFRREREAERRAALLRKKQSEEFFSPPPSTNNNDTYLFNTNSNNNTNANTSSVKSGKKTSSIGQERQVSNPDHHQQKYSTGHIESRQKRFSCPTGPQYSSPSDNRDPSGAGSSSAPHQQKRSSMMLMQHQTTRMQYRNSNDSGCSSRKEDNDGGEEIDLNEISTEIDSSMENMKLNNNNNNNNWSLMKKSSLDGSEKSAPAQKSVKIVKSLKKTLFSKRSGSTDYDNC